MLGSIFAKSMAERLAEHDLWWHLKIGQLIVSSHHLPSTDPFSFTAVGKHWVIQQWGSEVILHGIQHALGLRGIIVWRSVMLLAIYSVMAWLYVRSGGNNLWTWAIIALAAYAGAPDWIERPTLFSFLIFAVVLCLTLRPTQRVWWCLPLFVVWVNLHALVLLGLGYLILVAGAETLKEARGFGTAGWARRLRLVTLGCIVATFINPYGPRFIFYALGLVKTVSSTAAEWASPNFHLSLTFPFLLLALITLAALSLSPRRPDLTDVVLTIAFLGLGLYAVRNLPVSGMVLGFIALKYAPDAARAALHREDSTGGTSPVSLVPGIALLLVVSLTLGALVWHRFPRSDSLLAVADPAFPVSTIASLPNQGVRLFADDRWAALAIYMKWPGTHVAFDGRGELYGASIINKYERTIAGRPDWESWLKQICPTHILIQENGGLANVIETSPDWRVLRRDPIARGDAILLVPAHQLPGCPS